MKAKSEAKISPYVRITVFVFHISVKVDQPVIVTQTESV